MLKLLRRKNVTKKIFYALAIIIIPAFVIWGSANFTQKDKTPRYAGIIFGEKVSFDDFRYAMMAWATQLKLQYGEKTNEIINAFFNPVEATWDRLILLHEVKKRKVKVDNQEIIDAITKFPFLQKDGQFDAQAYELFLKYSLDIPARTFEEQLRQNIAMGKIFKEVTKNITMTEEEIEKSYNDQNEQTRVKYASFPSQGYKDKITVSDDELKEFYENSTQEFLAPPQINTNYLMIKWDQQTSEPEKEAARKKMREAKTLAKHKSLDDIAKELNLEKQTTGFFGLSDPIPTLGWMPQLGPALFDLPLDHVSEIIELENGIFIFKTIEKKDAHLPDFKEVKEKATTLLKNKKSKEMARAKAIEFITKLNSKPAPLSADFEKAAKELNIEIKETPLFSRDAYIPELGIAEPLKKIAFSLKKEEFAKEPIELEQGYYCIQSLEIIMVDSEKYKKEKEAFKDQLLSQKKSKEFSGYFDDLKKQAHLTSYIDEDTVKKGRRF